MRQEQRVERLCRLVYRIWSKNRDLRLLQLILNATDIKQGDNYFVEDEVIEKNLRKMYNDSIDIE